MLSGRNRLLITITTLFFATASQAYGFMAPQAPMNINQEMNVPRPVTPSYNPGYERNQPININRNQPPANVVMPARPYIYNSRPASGPMPIIHRETPNNVIAVKPFINPSIPSHQLTPVPHNIIAHSAPIINHWNNNNFNNLNVAPRASWNYWSNWNYGWRNNYWNYNCWNCNNWGYNNWWWGNNFVNYVFFNYPYYSYYPYPYYYSYYPIYFYTPVYYDYYSLGFFNPFNLVTYNTYNYYSSNKSANNFTTNVTWITAKNGDVPSHAILYQYKNNKSSYYCRSKLNSKMYYGILYPKDGCYINANNNTATIRFEQYQVKVAV